MTDDKNGQLIRVDFDTLKAMMDAGEIEGLFGYTTGGVEVFAAPKLEYIGEPNEADEEEVAPLMTRAFSVARPGCCHNGTRHLIAQLGNGPYVCVNTNQRCLANDPPCRGCFILG